MRSHRLIPRLSPRPAGWIKLSRLRQVFDNTHVCVAVLDSRRHVVEANAAFCQLAGRTCDELRNVSAFDLLHPGELPIDDGPLEEQFLRGDAVRVQRRLLRPDDIVVWADVSLIFVDDGNGRGQRVVLVAEDITARRAAEEALRQSEEQLRIVFEHAPVGIRLVGLDGRALRVNPEFEKMVGYSEQELSALHFAEITYPDDRTANLQLWQALRRGETDHYTLEKRYVRHDGSILWSSMHAALVRDAHGEPWFAVAMDADSTDRHHLQEELLQAQKLEAVGRLAGGVAHDFNNLLTTILGCSHLLLRDLPAGSRERGEAEQIADAAERAAARTAQLLAFGRQQTLHPSEVDLNDVVRGTTSMLEHLLGADIAVELRLAPALGAVRADPAQLGQVVVNLALNARDAMPAGGRLVVATANRTRSEGGDGPPLPPGDYVELAVTDTGVGMDAETRAHIFEPFFTTKGQVGSGLGLATVHGIVEQSGGYIETLSLPGEGSTFRVLLPQLPAPGPGAAEPPAEAPAGTPATATAAASTTILLVEDELPVRRITARILTDAGYEVLEADCADAAVAVARAHAAPIDLLLSDVRMPGESGPELARRLRPNQPGMCVMFMSGFAAPLEGDLAGSPFLEKPFTPDDLEAMVRDVLANHHGGAGAGTAGASTT